MEPDSNVDESEAHLVRKQVHEYSCETSIHGLKYVFEKKRTTFERWVVIETMIQVGFYYEVNFDTDSWGTI